MREYNLSEKISFQAALQANSVIADISYYKITANLDYKTQIDLRNNIITEQEYKHLPSIPILLTSLLLK
jgi:hypothetical protein